ncbi:hypothetical protein ISS42_02950 [Candidatus Shapirobacteria bacterium]|nr:hypothetical protein [Candidatus Shapirobacteria bacterium]
MREPYTFSEVEEGKGEKMEQLVSPVGEKIRKAITSEKGREIREGMEFYNISPDLSFLTPNEEALLGADAFKKRKEDFHHQHFSHFEIKEAEAYLVQQVRTGRVLVFHCPTGLLAFEHYLTDEGDYNTRVHRYTEPSENEGCLELEEEIFTITPNGVGSRVVSQTALCFPDGERETICYSSKTYPKISKQWVSQVMETAGKSREIVKGAGFEIS